LWENNKIWGLLSSNGPRGYGPAHTQKKVFIRHVPKTEQNKRVKRKRAKYEVKVNKSGLKLTSRWTWISKQHILLPQFVACHNCGCGQRGFCLNLETIEMISTVWTKCLPLLSPAQKLRDSWDAAYCVPSMAWKL